MTIIDAQVGTRIDEVADGIYRIHTPFRDLPGGFSFNQYLVVDDEPLLFHTGPRQIAPLVRAAIQTVVPLAKLRWIGFSHAENDESGGMDELLATSPHAQPVCSRVGAMVNATSSREPRGLGDGETLTTGKRTLRWIDAPHVPHGWDCGYLFDESSKTLFCGDLFTQPGAEHAPVTESDILGPSEAFRAAMDYYSHTKLAAPSIDKLVATEPRLLACMHGAAWRGDGGKLLRALGEALGAC
jgi:flavorubredoxin